MFGIAINSYHTRKNVYLCAHIFVNRGNYKKGKNLLTLQGFRDLIMTMAIKCDAVVWQLEKP